MKHSYWVVLLAVALAATQASGQLINAFDELPDTNYFDVALQEGAEDTTEATIFLETTQVHEGAGALGIDYAVQAYASWGGYSTLQHWHPDSNSVYDFSPWDTMSIWYYNAVDDPNSVIQFRINFCDVSNSVDGPKTYSVDLVEEWYSFHYILDDEPGWNQILMPMKDVGSDAFAGSNGFYLTGWAGIYGNSQLDLDQIKGFFFEFSIDGALYNSANPSASGVGTGTIYLDRFELLGAAPMAFIMFNGKAVPTNVTLDPGWSGGIVVEEGAGMDPATNALKWSVGSQWSGPSFTLDRYKNLFNSWSVDSV
ncbi:MAG: hypothetical protein ACETWG_07065, partial [Candidatus Neomarinimicrobiota bacterium]